MCYPLLTDILDESDAANAVVVTAVGVVTPAGAEPVAVGYDVTQAAEAADVTTFGAVTHGGIVTLAVVACVVTDAVDESLSDDADGVAPVVTEAPDGSLADDAAAVALGLTNAPDVSLGGDANGVAANDVATNPKAHYQCPGTISMYLHVHLHVPPI